MRAYDSVMLTDDLSETARAGMAGAIVETWAAGAYEVEVFDKAGNTVGVYTARADQLTVTMPDFFDGERVALLADLPAQGLRRGRVGVIEVRVAEGAYRVVFEGGEDGETVRGTVHATQMLLLHWTPAERSA